MPCGDDFTGFYPGCNAGFDYTLVGAEPCTGIGPDFVCPAGWTTCTYFGTGPCICVPPDVVSRYQALYPDTISSYPRNCVFSCGVGVFSVFPVLCDCECAVCLAPESFYDAASGYCLSERCAAGFCYCAATNTCIDCTTERPKRCDGVATNTWDPLRCLWVATPPDCGPGSSFDWGTCSCTACPAGQCYCIPAGRCVNCGGASEPPCKTERGCVWNQRTCQWDCTDPTCAAGEHYDRHVCRCVSDCPAGECWCEASSPPACISCTEPDCADELNCEWDVTTCTWVCDDPATVCGPDRTWDTAHCRCDKPDTWNLKTPEGGLHVASTLKGIRYQRADLAEAPYSSDVDVTTDPADYQARMLRDWQGRLYLLNNHLGEVHYRTSDDDGATWTPPSTIAMAGKHPTPIGPHRFTGCMVFARYDGGVIKATRQYPGDSSPSTEFTFQDDTAADLAVDDGTFHVVPQDDAPGRWVLSAYQGGTLKRWESFDECDSFLEIV